jgi:eukaryotic-like serine/threonine-protein kinase
MSMSHCPSSDQLEQMLEEQLGEADLRSVSLHVNGCAHCQAALENLTAGAQASVGSLSSARHDANLIRADATTLFLNRLKAPSVFASLNSRGGKAGGSFRDGGAAGNKLPGVPGFEIISELGRGGMGVVYLARQVGLNRLVALKMILAGSQADQKDLARFRHEAEAVARLRHPNIVEIHDIGEAERAPYFALEYVEEGNLGSRIRGEPQELGPAAKLMETLARTVHFAHQRGIVHRDLKPANILLASIESTTDADSGNEGGRRARRALDAYRPKITDFGLAKRLDDETSASHSGELVGTPSYMAPEQAGNTGFPVSTATDVYALGTILYEMLTGRPPFKGATPLDTVIQVLHEEPVRPSQLRPGLPRDLETICLKCLNKNPAQRYASAEALADDLQRFRKGSPIQARPISFPERAFKLARRRPLTAALMAGMWLSVVAGFAGVVWQWRHAVAEKQNKEIERQQAELARAEALEERRKAQQALYYSRLSQSQLQWRASDVTGAVQNLLDCVPQPDQVDPRGWEWYYLLGLFHSDLYTLQHSAAGNGGAAAFHPDGRTIASLVGGFATDDDEHPGEVRIWDAASGTPLNTFRAPGTAHRLVYRPDGKRLALATTDGSVLVWDAATGSELVRSPPDGQTIANLTFSPDGNKLAWASWDQTVRVCDATTLKTIHVFKGHSGRVQCVAFHPDGQRLASGDAEAVVKIWDIEAGAELMDLRGHKSPVYGVAFSPDGSLLSTGGSNGNLKIWDMKTGKVVQSLTGRSGAVLDSCFSPDGRYLAYCGGDATVRVWDVESGTERLIFRGHTAAVESVKFSPDGRRLVSSSPAEAVVKIWDCTCHPEQATFARVRGNAEDKVQVRDLTGRADSSLLARTGPDLEAIVFHADGEHIVSMAMGGSLQTWDAVTGLLVQQRSLPISDELVSPAVLAAFRPDGVRLAARLREDKRIAQAWDVAGGAEAVVFRGHTMPIICLRYSADGRRLVSSACDLAQKNRPHEIKVWDADSGACLATRTGFGLLFSVALAPDGRTLASCGQDGLVLLADWTKSNPAIALPGHKSHVAVVVFSADGSRLATAGMDKVLKIWELDGFDVSRGKPPTKVNNLASAPPLLCDVAFSPDGRRLAGITRDTVKLWDVGTQRLVITLRGAVQRHWDPVFNPRVLFSPDGNRLIGTNWDESISMWDAGLTDDDGALAARQSSRRLAAEGRADSWHLEEAENCLEHHNRLAALFHVRQLGDRALPAPLQVRKDRVTRELAQ